MDPAQGGTHRSSEHDEPRDAATTSDSEATVPGPTRDDNLPAALSSIDLAQRDEPEDAASISPAAPTDSIQQSLPTSAVDAANTATGSPSGGGLNSADASTPTEHSTTHDGPENDTPSDEQDTHQQIADESSASAHQDQTSELSLSDNGASDDSDNHDEDHEDDEDDDDDDDDGLVAPPQERRLTLLEALNETRESATQYSSSATPNNISIRGRRPHDLIDNSPPLPASPPPPPPPHTRPPANRSTSEFVLPRWQPDAEVTLCPICSTQFGIFVRKHHCRKCGRVVCNACSPHRIVIPYQYIVRPPGEYPFPPYPEAGEEMRIADFSSISGGERVRLCNPCVPDPNMTPPQSQGFPGSTSPRPPHQRSHSSSNPPTGFESSSSSHFQPYPMSPRTEAHARNRSITMNSGAGPSGHSGYYSRSARTSGDRPMYYSSSYSGSSADPRQSSRRQNRDNAGLQSAINRPLPPAPQIPEEDECPVCHLELPSRDLPDAEARREAHINDCITYHSTYNPRRATLMASAGEHGTPPPRTERRTGMFPYVATEKDCVDDAECTICFEEYEAGDQMCRLECLCRFHRICIAAWFENHPGRCPVHQHDSYGY